MAGNVGSFFVDFDESRNKDGINLEVANLASQIVRFQFGRVRPEEDRVSGNHLKAVICECRRKIVFEVCANFRILAHADYENPVGLLTRIVGIFPTHEELRALGIRNGKTAREHNISAQIAAAAKSVCERL